MARSHGRVLSSIWGDDDFRALAPEIQRLYTLLLSQSNLTHAGTMTLTVRRWARMSVETDEGDIRYGLELLEESRFIVIDWDTEELLVRTLIRNDGVFKQPRVMAAAGNEARAVSSPQIRHAIRQELERLPLDQVTDKMRDEVAKLVKTLGDDLSTPAYTPADTPEYGLHSNQAVTDIPSTRARAHSPSPTPSPKDEKKPPRSEPDGSQPAEDPSRLDVAQLCTLLADGIEANGSKRPRVTKAWQDDARRLLDRDGRPLDEATELIRWCQQDAFWRTNILSMPKFREQYDRLRLRSQQAAAPVRVGEARPGLPTEWR